MRAIRSAKTGFTTMKRLAAFAALISASVAVPNATFAASTTTGKLEVRLEVVPGCALASGSGSSTASGAQADATLSFGRTSGDTIDPADGPAVASTDGSALSVVCSTSYTGPSAPMLTIDAGAHSTGTQRHMAGPGGALVAYELYQDQGRNIPYDPTAASQLIISTAGTAAPVMIYGRVPSAAGLADGLYTDTVTLMLSY
jgi:spore coat protein U-like protein